MTLEKKKKAALAAVMQYLETERELQAGTGKAGPVAAIPDNSMLYTARPWGLSGRNAAMQTRTMMYYRALRG